MKRPSATGGSARDFPARAGFRAGEVGTVGDDELDEMPVVLYEAYNPATDEAPVGGDTDCDGVDPEDGT